MSASISRFLQFCGLTCCFSLCAGTAWAGELTLKKVPPLTIEQAPAYPENLARYHFGAQVEAAPDTNPVSNLRLSSKSEDRNTAEAALLCDDPTVGYAISNGAKTLLISLSKIENIDRVAFLNHGVKGDVLVATSNAKLPADSPQWHVVAKQELIGEAVNAKIGPSEAKYVKLTFNVTEPGRIAALGVYSTPTISAFTMPRARKLNADHSDTLALISYNLTDLHAKARALYVSSGDEVKQANNMIDDQPSTIYAFASADTAPTAIIDLGKVTRLRRISTLYSPRQGNVEFFVLNSLPGVSSENAPRSLKLNDASLKSVGLVMDNGTGRAAIDFPETSGRYVMVKWEPAAAKADGGFSVAEIAAFGGKGGNLIAANESLMESDGKSTIDAKDLGSGKDFSKEMPAEGPESPAEGPAPGLPDPPPFTFVPQLTVPSG